MSNVFINALGLDVGSSRIGVARISSIARISEPLAVLANNEDFIKQLQKLLAEHSIDLIVVGMPRNMSGEKTAQSEYVEQFVDELKAKLDKPIVFQDETLSTVAASQRVTIKTKSMEDAYAAAVILEDFMESES